MKSLSGLRGALVASTFVLAAVVALACTPPAPKKDGGTNNATAGATAGATGGATAGATTGGTNNGTAGAPGMTAAAAGSECSQYANGVCEKAGEQSETCVSVRSLSEVMSPKACAAGLADMQFTVGKIDELKGKCAELANKLCGDIGEQSQTCEMVRKVTPNFPPDRCRDMLSQYPQVLAELKAQEERNKPLSAEKQALIAADDAPAFGPKEAKVTIVEFSDFECPYCTMAASVTQQVKEKYAGEVRFVFRQYPLPFHPNAHLASQAALAAGQQGKFWEYHDKLFQNQKALTRADLEKYAQELKLDMAAFKKALDDKTFAAKVDSDIKMGGEVAVDGTPTMFLNGERVANPTSFEVVAQMIDVKLGRAPAPPAAPGGEPGHEGHGHP